MFVEVAPAPVETKRSLDEDVRDTFRRAKELLLNKGWTKGYLKRETTRGMHYCLVGAIAEVHDCLHPTGAHVLPTGGYSDYLRAVEALEEAAPNECTHAPCYNDVFCETVDDAVALLDKALAR